MNILAGKSAYVPERLAQDMAIGARIQEDKSQLSFEIEVGQLCVTTGRCWNDPGTFCCKTWVQPAASGFPLCDVTASRAHLHPYQASHKLQCRNLLKWKEKIWSCKCLMIGGKMDGWVGVYYIYFQVLFNGMCKFSCFWSWKWHRKTGGLVLLENSMGIPAGFQCSTHTHTHGRLHIPGKMAWGLFTIFNTLLPILL